MVAQHIVGGRYAGTIFGGFARTRCGGGGCGSLGAVGGGSFWGQREHGDSLGAAVARGRSCAAPRDGRRPPLAPGRASAGSLGVAGQAAGPDLAGDPRRAGGTRDQHRPVEFVAVSQGAEHHAQKKSLHAAEQSLPRRRPGIAPTSPRSGGSSSVASPRSIPTA